MLDLKDTQAELSLAGFNAATAGPDAVFEVADLVAARLRAYPHFAVVKGLAPADNNAFAKQVATAIANRPPANGRRRHSGRSRFRHFARSMAKGHPLAALKSPEYRPDMSFGRIEIDPSKPIADGKVTRYSRTNQPIDLHSDCSYMLRPRELVVFQMVRDDHKGGDTLMAAVEDIVADLDEDMRATLMHPAFPFGAQAPLPVIWNEAGAPNIRFYKAQIDMARAENGPLSKPRVAALDALDELLRREELMYRFHIDAGDIVFIHNTKALHGRTGFAGASERLMLRIRSTAPGLL